MSDIADIVWSDKVNFISFAKNIFSAESERNRYGVNFLYLHGIKVKSVY